MQPIYVYLSGLAATFALLHRLWSYAPLERAFFGAAGIGLSVYLVLLLGHAFTRYIAKQAEAAKQAAEPEEETDEQEEKTTLPEKVSKEA